MTITCFSDTLGNRLDLYDTIRSFDDWMHFINTGLLAAAFLLLTLHHGATLGAVVERSLAFGVTAALAWELAEYVAFLSTSGAVDRYADTLGDLTLGALGSLVAGLIVHRAWQSGHLRSAAPQIDSRPPSLLTPHPSTLFPTPSRQKLRAESAEVAVRSDVNYCRTRRWGQGGGRSRRSAMTASNPGIQAVDGLRTVSAAPSVALSRAYGVPQRPRPLSVGLGRGRRLEHRQPVLGGRDPLPAHGPAAGHLLAGAALPQAGQQLPGEPRELALRLVHLLPPARRRPARSTSRTATTAPTTRTPRSHHTQTGMSSSSSSPSAASTDGSSDSPGGLGASVPWIAGSGSRDRRLRDDGSAVVGSESSAPGGSVVGRLRTGARGPGSAWGSGRSGAGHRWGSAGPASASAWGRSGARRGRSGGRGEGSDAVGRPRGRDRGQDALAALAAAAETTRRSPTMPAA